MIEMLRKYDVRFDDNEHLKHATILESSLSKTYNSQKGKMRKTSDGNPKQNKSWKSLSKD